MDLDLEYKMNEKVKKLADQAYFYANEEYKNWKPTLDFSGVPHVRTIFNQKFSELIINECLEQVRDELQYLHDWASADAVTKRVKEHFGVE